MSEIQFIGLKRNKERLILFVHGFTGSIETWNNSSGVSFPDLLLENAEIKNNFDIACYEYFSKLTDLYSTTAHKYRTLKRIFGRSTFKPYKNLSIEEIASNLGSTIRFRLADYEDIVIIAHSMGGLVVKNVIIDDFNREGSSRIKFFISLAVPHQGAEAAAFGSLISNNIQIENLRSVGAFITDLNRNWINLNPKPVTKYFFGTYDTIVPKESAVSVDNEIPDTISVNENHTS